MDKQEKEYHLWEKEDKKDYWKNYYCFAEAYRKAALELLSIEKNKDDYNAEDILPVLQCFCQYIELIFKVLLLKENIKIKETLGHNLYGLYKKVKKKYEDFELSKNVIYFIEDLEKLNKGGQSFRYPISNKGKRFWINHISDQFLSLKGLIKISKQTIGEIILYIKKKQSLI